MFTEIFDSIADAIGWTAQDEYRVVGFEKTDSLDIALKGYIHTYYVMDEFGVKWTVFFDPARGIYTGAHMSSKQV